MSELSKIIAQIDIAIDHLEDDEDEKNLRLILEFIKNLDVE